MKAQLLLVAASMCLSGSAWSQGCPAGIPSAGNPACIPPDRENSPYYHDSSGTAATTPQARWKLTWGAIAIDSFSGDVGTAVGKFSKGDAKHDAMDRCSAQGARKCESVLSYQNQCAVIAWPQVIGYGVIVQGGPSVAVASKIALSTCKANGVACKIVYSDCTKPVLVQ